jgi:hypothetical protein
VSTVELVVRCKARGVSDLSNSGIVDWNATGAIEEYRWISIPVLPCVGSGQTVLLIVWNQFTVSEVNPQFESTTESLQILWGQSFQK